MRFAVQARPIWPFRGSILQTIHPLRPPNIKLHGGLTDVETRCQVRRTRQSSAPVFNMAGSRGLFPFFPPAFVAVAELSFGIAELVVVGVVFGIAAAVAVLLKKIDNARTGRNAVFCSKKSRRPARARTGALQRPASDGCDSSALPRPMTWDPAFMRRLAETPCWPKPTVSILALRNGGGVGALAEKYDLSVRSPIAWPTRSTINHREQRSSPQHQAAPSGLSI